MSSFLFIMAISTLCADLWLNPGDLLEKAAFLVGEYDIELNVTESAILEVNVENESVQLSFPVEEDDILTKSFEFERFIINFPGFNNYSNETLGFAEIIIPKNITLVVSSPCLVTLSVRPFVVLEDAKISQLMEGNEISHFMYHYQRKQVSKVSRTNVANFEIFKKQKTGVGILTVFGIGAPNPWSNIVHDARFLAGKQMQLIDRGDEVGFYTNEENGCSTSCFVFFEISCWTLFGGQSTNECAYTVRASSVFYFPVNYLFYLLITCLFIACVCLSAIVFVYRFFARMGRSRQNPWTDAVAAEEVRKNEVHVELPESDTLEYDERRKRIPDTQTCCVCLDYRKCVKFVPCDHVCTCKWCSDAVEKSSGMCPLCRAPIENMTILDLPDLMDLPILPQFCSTPPARDEDQNQEKSAAVAAGDGDDEVLEIEGNDNERGGLLLNSPESSTSSLDTYVVISDPSVAGPDGSASSSSSNNNQNQERYQVKELVLQNKLNVNQGGGVNLQIESNEIGELEQQREQPVVLENEVEGGDLESGGKSK